MGRKIGEDPNNKNSLIVEAIIGQICRLLFISLGCFNLGFCTEHGIGLDGLSSLFQFCQSIILFCL